MICEIWFFDKFCGAIKNKKRGVKKFEKPSKIQGVITENPRGYNPLERKPNGVS